MGGRIGERIANQYLTLTSPLVWPILARAGRQVDGQYSSLSTNDSETSFSTAGLTPYSRSNPGPILAFLAILFFAGEILSFTGIVRPPHSLLVKCFLGKGTFFLSSAFLGLFLIHLAHSVSRQERIISFVIGLLLEGVLFALRNQDITTISLLLNVGAGFGIGSVLVQAIYLVYLDKQNRQLRLLWLMEGLIAPSFVLNSLPFLDLTTSLHPVTYDYAVFIADNGLGFQLSFVLGQFVDSIPIIKSLLIVLYIVLPVVVAGVHAFRIWKAKSAGIETLESFLFLGVIGCILYHAFPVIGPRFAFGSYPELPSVDPEVLPRFDVMTILANRNCMPSLHTAWAIAIFLRTRALGLPIRLAGASFLGVTILATLGLGYHYAFDLVVAIPFAIGVDGLPEVIHTGWPRAKTISVGICALLTAIWMLALYFVPDFIGAHPLFAWLSILATIFISILCRRILTRDIAHHIETPSVEKRVEINWSSISIAAIFTVSGFAGLLYEVIFAKSLALTFGSTSRAATTVLATYMGGLALGAWLGGRIAARTSQPIRLYAYCEIIIGIWCAATPLLFDWLHQIYITIGAGTNPGSTFLLVAQIVLGATALLPPTILMGVTMPLMVKHLEQHDHSFAHSVALLYAANTGGAAAGALAAGYLVLPVLGVYASTMFAVMLDFMAALAALRIRSVRSRSSKVPQVPLTIESPMLSSAKSRLYATIALIILGLGGFVTLALEVVDVHLLGVVAGTSTYAFSLMLFAFLIGLGIGAAISRRFLVNRGSNQLTILSWLELAIAIILLGGVFLWDSIPDYFASFEKYPLTRTFAEREVVRGVVCCLIMIPQSMFIGAVYPLAIDLFATSVGGSRVRALGVASAINTVGNIAGVVIATFVLLPVFGSLHSIHTLAAIAYFLSCLACVVAGSGRARRVVIPVLVGAAMFVVQPASFDWTSIASGANVYFSKHWHGQVIDFAESADGGLTTVSRRFDANGRPIHTLLSNGKFQGDDSFEMTAQVAFALCPLLHTTARENALVIGYGTGVSAGTIHRAGFRHLDISELAADIVSLADRYFSDANGSVSRQQNVELSISDGRNYLLLTNRQYDLISMEITSIWFAGCSSLYNREFYKIARQRLKERGVLQQWIQLHHIDQVDIASILATIRAEFESVYLYYIGNQGIIVACEKECPPTQEALALLEEAPGLTDSMAVLGGSFESLSKALLLDTAGVDRFISGVTRELGIDPATLISTDDNLLLEYRTPRGNVRPHVLSLRENLEYISRYR